MKREHRVLDSPTDERPTASRTPIFRWVARFALGLVIVVLLSRRHDAASLWLTLRAVPPAVLLASVAFYWMGQMLSAWKWQLLLRAAGAQISLRTCLRLYFVGMFWNLWMPTNIGGDVVRALRIAPFCGGKAVATSSVLLERLTGVIALIAIAFCGLAFQFAAKSSGQSEILALRPLLLAIITLLVLTGAFFFARRRTGNAGEISPWLRKLRALSDALAFYGSTKSRRTLWMALAISLVFQASQVLLNIGLAHAVGLNVSANTFWWLVPTLAIASLVPLGIGGLGVREAAALQLLAGSGASAATVIAWSLLWQTTVWLASLPGVLWATSRADAG